MPADNELDPLDRWLNRQVRPLPPPAGTFELITKRARRRRIRKAVISVAGAAAVAAAVGVAVPVGMSLHLNTKPTNAGFAAGQGKPTVPTQTTLGKASSEPSASATSRAASVSASAGTTSAGPNTPGWLPSDFQPNSVTWDSTSTGWVLGPAGTPGQCGAQQDSSICTSIAITHDGGATWSGLPAPTTNEVTGLRFLNATDGWAFGPQLWATDDGGNHWHLVDTGNLSVPQLETIDGRAYALFADCRAIDGNPDAACTSYTLESATAGSDDWTPVGGVPGDLTGGSADFTQAAGQQDAALLELAGATGAQPATGYLVAPDGTLYAGPLDGTAWHKAATLPCVPGPGSDGYGQPQALQLTPDGTTSPSGATRLALVCHQGTWPAGVTSVYLSTDNGSAWTEQAGVTSMPGTAIPTSLTSLPDGTLILAAMTLDSRALSGGIYLLPPGATQWRAASLSDPSGKTSGFTYVGMTSPTQGVALGGVQSLHAIWMTTDGGRTWQARPIKS
ncbi:MAG TPA: hypothetical protein VHT26_17325 [Trebonia sp.]|nr:hypothetical protein [Trebonia sp.]